MAIYHGKKGRVYLSTSGSSEATDVSKLTKWTIDLTQDTVEGSCFGDTNKVYVQGLADAKGTLDFLFDDTVDTLFNAAASTTACKMYLYPSSDAITKYWYGTAWISIKNVETDIGGVVKGSADWVAGGVWARK